MNRTSEKKCVSVFEFGAFLDFVAILAPQQQKVKTKRFYTPSHLRHLPSNFVKECADFFEMFNIFLTKSPFFALLLTSEFLEETLSNFQISF